MAAEFKDHFSEVAQSYAAFRPHYPEALFEYLAGLNATHGAVWDCACGSGQASMALAAHFDRVYATDASAGQIAAASPHPGVEYRVAPAESSGLAEGSLELVTVAQALHWFDLPSFFAEVERVLKPGGHLAVWSYGVHRLLDGELDGTMQHFYHEVVGAYWPPERKLVESGYRDIALPFAEIDPPHFEMLASWELPQLLGYLRSWSAVARCRQATGVDPVDAFAKEIAGLWGERPIGVVWPLTLRVCRKPD